MTGRFADGVWLAELAAVRDPAQVAAAALGIRDLPTVAAADALAHALARRQLLLVATGPGCWPRPVTRTTPAAGRRSRARVTA